MEERGATNYLYRKYWGEYTYDKDACRKKLNDWVLASPNFDIESKSMKYFDTVISTKRFLRDLDYTSAAFQNLGLRRGEIIFMFCLNSPETVTSLYAINNIGGISEWYNAKGMTVELMRKDITDNKIRFLVISDVIYPLVKEAIQGTTVEKVIVNSIRDSMGFITNSVYSAEVFGVHRLLGTKRAQRILSGSRERQPSLFDRKVLELDEFAERKLIKQKASFHLSKDKDERFMCWDDFVCSYGMSGAFTPVPYEDDETTLIVHTGGTTGPVKRIAMTDHNINSFVYKTSLMHFNIESGDSFCQLVPPMVAWSLAGIHLSRYYNMLIHLIPSYDKEEFVKTMLKTRANHYFTVPAFVKTLIDNPKLNGSDLSFIKSINHGGEYMTPEDDEAIDRALRQHGAVIKNRAGFGQNEVFGCFTANLDSPECPKDHGCCGIPLVGNEFLILDPATKEVLPCGINDEGKPNIGEIHVSGETLMNGYYGNDTTENHNNFMYIGGKRYFNTGDQGYADKNGKLWFYVRDARIIRKKDGGKVFSNVLETILNGFPEVEASCVVSAPNGSDKEVSCHIILKDSYRALANDERLAIYKAIIARMDEHAKTLYSYYMPDSYRFESEGFPLTPFGKVDYRKIEAKNMEEYEKNGRKKLPKLRY